MPFRVLRRLAVVIATVLLVGIPGGVVLAGAGGATGTISASIPNPTGAPFTAQLSGTWVWPEFKAPCGPGTSANRAAGWAIDWGDGFTGNRSKRKGSNPASYVHLGDATDNTVHHSSANSGLGDCGNGAATGTTGTWGPIIHTYAAPGTYTACVSIYDIHYKNVDRTKLKAAITNETTFAVANASALAAGDVLVVDSELMLVTGTSGNTITVARAVNGTTIASHRKNAKVKEIVPSDPDERVAGSNAAKYTAGDHNSDNSVEKNGASGPLAQCLPVTFRIYGRPGISVEKTPSATQAHLGDTVTYTFVVTNTGDSEETVVVSDPRCDSGTLSGPSGDANGDAKLDLTETWTYTCTHAVAVGDGDPLHNVVTAVGTNPVGATATDTDEADVDVLHPAIHVLKATNTAMASIGDTVTYTFTVTNAGDIALHGVTVSDALCDASPTGPTGDTNLDGELGTTESWTYSCTHRVTIADPNPLVNIVNVAGTDPLGRAVTATDTRTVDLTPQADLSLTKDDGVTSVVAGTNTTYTFTVTNQGPSDVVGATVSDPLPTGVTFISGAAGVTYDSSANTVFYAVPFMGNGGSASFIVTVGVNAGFGGGSVTNTATVSPPAGTTDPTPGNNSGTDTDTVTRTADLSVSKNDGVTSVVAGTTTTYTITVTNFGPSDVAGATVSDVLPAGLTFISGSPGVSFDAGTDTVHYATGSLSHSSGTESFTMTLGVDAGFPGGSVTNTATVSPPTGTTDSTPGNNTASETDTITRTADLSVSKDDGVTSVVAGTNTTYTLTVTNHGPSAVIGATVTDPLPAGVTFVSATGGATYNPGLNSVFWFAIVAGPGDSQVATVTVAVDPGASASISNTATVSPPGGTTEINPADNTATDTDTVTPQVDVAVTKTDNADTVSPGTSTTYTIIVSNVSAATATGVSVSDPLPIGVTSAGWSGNGQANVSGALSDMIATLAPGASVTYTLIAQISAAAAGSIVNTATISAAGDPNSSNDVATDTDTVTAPNQAPTDITLSNSSLDENQPSGTLIGGLTGIDPDAGQTLTFTLSTGCASGPFPFNGAVSISGGNLYSTGALNHEVDSAFAICVRATDDGSPNMSFDKVLLITVNDVNDPPFAGADTYTGAIGNTLASVGGSPTGPHVVLAGNVLTSNDSDEDQTFPHTISAVAETVTSTGGGTATIAADGSFTFLPGVGDKNMDDTFTYHVTDGSLTSAGTVTVHIEDSLVWYVDNAAAAGDGRSSSPLNSLAPLNGGADPDGSGDIIFVYSGSGNYGGLALEAGQQLLGQPNGLVVLGNTLVAAAGANPVLVNGSGNCITLSTGNTIQGVSTGDCTGTGISGSAVGTLTIGTATGVSVNNGTGKAVDIATGALAVTLASASSTGSTTNGIHLASTTGSFTVSGGTIQTAAGDGISLSSVSNVSLSSMTIQNNRGSGIRGTNVTGFSLSGSTVSGNGDDAAADEAGIRFDGLLGTASISSTTVSGSVKDNIRIVNSSGTLTSLAITGSTISSNNATTGNDGLTLEANSSANMTVSVTNTNFHDNRARGIKATTNGAGNLDLTVDGGAYTTNTIHVDLADNSTGALTFDVLNTTMSTTHAADGSPINVFQGTGSASGNMVGTISGNTITNNDSLSGPGITALATGTGQMVVKISGNNVSHVANLGISAIASQGSSRLDATVINNTVTLTGADAAHGITVESGSSLTTDTNAVCAVITGNSSSTTGASQFGIRVRNRQTGTTFSLPGYGGSATNDAAVASFLAAANTASTSASHGTSAGFAGGAACLIP